MAFVYCNDRWKSNKQNTSPGPCQYSLDQPQPSEQNPSSQSRLLKSMKKYREQRRMEEQPQPSSFNEIINQKMMQTDEMSKVHKLKANAKKGKVYRNHSVQTKNPQQKFIEHQTELKILIKNALHSQNNTGARNKWGNMRIKEMLNEHRENELKKNSMAFYNKQNKTVLIQDNKDKFKEDLKELQTIFTTQRKGCNANLQNLNKRRSPSRKHLTHNFSENHLRMSDPSIQELHIQPSAVYVSDKFPMEQQNYLKNENGYRYVSPTCSISNSKLAIKQKSLQTGIEDDTFDEDSMEYISDATPGPGSYNIHADVSRISSKVGKFGATMERFKQEKYSSQALLAPTIPDYKISTNAKQENVGFGKTTKEADLKPNQPHTGVFYEDYNNLQYKSLKAQCKSRKDNVCFDSSKDRFPEQNKKLTLTESQEDNEEDNQEQMEEDEVKPTCIFMSKVNRELYLNKQTEDVDFSGQNVNCIANKLKKQKEYYQDYDLTPAGFMTVSKRFIYKEVKVQEKKVEILGIKIEELKKKKELKMKPEEKGYTFSKDIKRELSSEKMEDVPSPNHYQKIVKWIKPSYNIRFN